MSSPERTSPFASFFMGGFECSSHRHPSGRRIDVIDATRHDLFAQQDYARLAGAGMQAARDGLRWPLIERQRGSYDFSSAAAQVRAAQEAGVQVIWDLLHYGYPDFISPFDPEFPQVFAAYAQAATRFLRSETAGTLWLCPVNEISFMAWGAGDVGYLNPFARNRGTELKRALVRASIAAMQAARAVDPEVRFLHAEPLIAVSGHPGSPQSIHESAAVHEGQFEVLEMLRGRLHPELGGHEDFIDLIGLNYYPYNQWRHPVEGLAQQVLHPGHPAYTPLSELITQVARRFGRPLIIAETGTEGEGRADWLRDVVRAALSARQQGATLWGLCLYPVVNHPGWDDDRHCHNGLWDYPDQYGNRAADPALWAALQEVQEWERSGLPAAQRHLPWAQGEASRRLAEVAAALLTEAPERDRDGQFPAESLRVLREAGLLGCTLSPALGGGGVAGAERLTLLRRVGQLSLPVARIYEGHLNALELISQFGTPQQVQRAAQDALAGELFGVWNTEETPGVTLHWQEAEAGRAGLLAGAKTFASGAWQVTRALCPVQSPQGRLMTLLRDLDPARFDLSFWQPAGMRATQSGRADLSGVAVEAADSIGQPGDYYAQPGFSGGALRFLAAQIGGADAVLGAVRQTLTQLGRAKDDVQLLRFAQASAGLEGAWQVVLQAQARLEAATEVNRVTEATRTTEVNRVPEALLAYLSLARLLTEDACLAVCEAAERAAGARGLLPPTSTERLIRDLRMYLRQPAPDAARLGVGQHVMAATTLNPWGQE